MIITIEHTIPAMTNALGRHWRQPHRSAIEVDDTHALMDEATFKALSEYSTSMPSGVYPGKMWKCNQRGTDNWWLCWYGVVEGRDDVCSNNNREILRCPA